MRMLYILTHQYTVGKEFAEKHNFKPDSYKIITLLCDVHQTFSGVSSPLVIRLPKWSVGRSQDEGMVIDEILHDRDATVLQPKQW